MDKLFKHFMTQGFPEDAALALSWSLMGRPRSTMYDNSEESVAYHGVPVIAKDALEDERARAARGGKVVKATGPTSSVAAFNRGRDKILNEYDADPVLRSALGMSGEWPRARAAAGEINEGAAKIAGFYTDPAKGAARSQAHREAMIDFMNKKKQ